MSDLDEHRYDRLAEAEAARLRAAEDAYMGSTLEEEAAINELIDVMLMTTSTRVVGWLCSAIARDGVVVWYRDSEAWTTAVDDIATGAWRI